MNRMDKKSTARVFTALAVAVVSSGCAMKGDIRMLQQELRAIAARQDSLVAELRMETLQTQDTLRTQTNQMFDFRGDIARRLQQIEQSLTRLEAVAGENQRTSAGIRDQLANLRRGGVAAGPGTGVTDPGGGGARDETLAGTSANADQVWTEAQRQLDRGSLTTASRAFEQFISEHPDDPRVPDAHFFLADILAQQNRPQEALEAFQEIQQLFPTAERVPQALYRVALLHEELGSVDQARAVLERIVNTYPGDPVAMLARDKLRQIG